MLTCNRAIDQQERRLEFRVLGAGGQLGGHLRLAPVRQFGVDRVETLAATGRPGRHDLAPLRAGVPIADAPSRRRRDGTRARSVARAQGPWPPRRRRTTPRRPPDDRAERATRPSSANCSGVGPASAAQRRAVSIASSARSRFSSSSTTTL